MKTKPLEQQVKDILLKHTKTNYTMQLADIVEAISNLVEEEVKKELEELSLAVVEPCEPDCTAERHARHQGTWQAHLVIEKRLEELSNE